MTGRLLLTGLLLLPAFLLQAQERDSVTIADRTITLSEVIIREGVDVPDFIRRVRADTSFYKAFRNLRILPFTSLNDIKMFDKKGRVKASLYSKTEQWADKGCRYTNVLEEQITGDMYDKRGQYNYYTAELYASLFFARDTICGETNIVGNTELSIRNKKGAAKHREQLKMLFFNPGKAIPGLPFIGNRTAIFDESMSGKYHYDLDMTDYAGELCYVFSVKAKQKKENSKADGVVIDEMVTWFSVATFEVLARNYTLSYKAGVYDFDVEMQVELMRYNNFVVPKLLRYIGDWDVVLKKREKAVFTATLFDFK